jgi:hypothetical protein
MSTASAEETPTYTNGRVITLDTAQRTLVVETAGGEKQKLELDDNTAGFGDIKSGDRVILMINGAPGRQRVSSISKVTASLPQPAPPTPRSTLPKATAGRPRRPAVSQREGGRRGSASRTGRQPVEHVQGHLRSHHERPIRRWPRMVRPLGRPGAGGSLERLRRDLYNQIIGQGEAVKTQMAAAEDVARRSLAPGAFGSRRRYALEWEGWGVSAPERLPQ